MTETFGSLERLSKCMDDHLAGTETAASMLRRGVARLEYKVKGTAANLDEMENEVLETLSCMRCLLRGMLRREIHDLVGALVEKIAAAEAKRELLEREPKVAVWSVTQHRRAHGEGCEEEGNVLARVFEAAGVVWRSGQGEAGVDYGVLLGRRG